MNFPIEKDFLIVGQGLAGTLLSHFLLAENQRIAVIDQPEQGAASVVAAGVMNPVTGRRIARSWRYDEFFPFAKKTYCELEQLLGIPLWKERNILRALPTVFDENEWDRRSAWPEHQRYIVEPADLPVFFGKIQPCRAWGELTATAQVAMPDLVFGWKKRLREMGWLIEEAFDYQQLVVHPEAVFYKNFRASGVIFCEGARALHNPFFNYLPFSVTKGEAMIVHIPGAGFTKILKRHVFIVPLENPEALQTAGLFLKNMPDLYWVGSTSRFEFEGTEPTSEQQTSLESDLKDVVKLPFEVVARLAGIRPTVYQQRPFLGRHPTLPNLLIFNGLGTKGASQGPFLAKQMADFLLGKGGVEEEVDISRFLPKE